MVNRVGQKSSCRRDEFSELRQVLKHEWTLTLELSRSGSSKLTPSEHIAVSHYHLLACGLCLVRPDGTLARGQLMES